MQKTRSALLAILMITAALAGCISEDTSDLDTEIEDLDNQNTELTQTIAERDLSISELEATIAGLESNVAGLEASITLMEEQRDALLALLSDSQEFANQTLELAEAMNETIAALHVMLGENATRVLQLQIDVHEWQQTAESNRAVFQGTFRGDPPFHTDFIGVELRNADLRYLVVDYVIWGLSNLSGANFSHSNIYNTNFVDTDLQGVNFGHVSLSNVEFIHSDLSGADLSVLYSHTGVTWTNTICPDGTNSVDNGDTCWNNI